jgi:hypothetical protein
LGDMGSVTTVVKTKNKHSFNHALTTIQIRRTPSWGRSSYSPSVVRRWSASISPPHTFPTHPIWADGHSRCL